MKWKRFIGDGPPNGDEESVYCVLGGEHIGAAVACRLEANGDEATLVDGSHLATGPPGAPGRATDDCEPESVDLSSASTVVVATRSDSQNLLIAQQVRTRFDVPRVLVLVNAPPRLEPFAEAGYDPVCATSALTDALVDSI